MWRKSKTEVVQAVLVLLVTIEIRQCLIGTLLLLPLLLLIKIIVTRCMRPGVIFLAISCESSVCGKSVIGTVERPKCDGVIAVSPAIYRFKG